ncbi:MAG: hypothetical protein M5U19_10015 [Microthrixaceae bacterium]|nr:hypothetical protein [Microthrixaceae bacterium]
MRSGSDAHVGLVERAERIMLLVVGLLFGGSVLVAILIAIAVLNLVTAGQRFAAVWSQATDATPTLSARRAERASGAAVAAPGPPARPRSAAPNGPSGADGSPAVDSADARGWTFRSPCCGPPLRPWR